MQLQFEFFCLCMQLQFLLRELILHKFSVEGYNSKLSMCLCVRFLKEADEVNDFAPFEHVEQQPMAQILMEVVNVVGLVPCERVQQRVVRMPTFQIKKETVEVTESVLPESAVIVIERGLVTKKGGSDTCCFVC